MEPSLPKDPVNLQLTLALRGLADRGLIPDDRGPERFAPRAEQISRALLQNPIGAKIHQAIAMSAFGFAPRARGPAAEPEVDGPASSSSNPDALASLIANFINALGTPPRPPAPSVDPAEIASMITAFAKAVAQR